MKIKIISIILIITMITNIFLPAISLAAEEQTTENITNQEEQENQEGQVQNTVEKEDEEEITQNNQTTETTNTTITKNENQTENTNKTQDSQTNTESNPQEETNTNNQEPQENTNSQEQNQQITPEPKQTPAEENLSTQELKTNQIRTLQPVASGIQGTYKIRSAINTKKVLDIHGSSTSNNANVEIYEDNNQKNQKYIIKPNTDNTYTIYASHSNKVLDVCGGGKTNETNVIQFTYNGGDNQKWYIELTNDGYYCFKSKSSGLYLDIYQAKAQNGQNVQIYEGHEGIGQKFKLEKVIKPQVTTIQNGIYQIATNNNKVIDISGASYENAANVILWYNSKAINQKYQFTRIGNTQYYTISAIHSRKVLDVENNNKNIGANVIQYSYTGADNQQWLIKDCGDGYYNIVSKSSELYLDVTGGNTNQAGANIELWCENEGNNQKFKLIPTTVENQNPFGIDVSEFNKEINWNYVKASGVDFAMIRIGYRGYRTGGFAEDTYFKKNIQGAKKAGVKVGIYFFTQAVNEQEAIEEANWTINKIKEAGYDKQIEYPISIDTESSGGNPPGRADGLDVQTRTKVCKAFCETIKSYGYKPMIYASKNWFNNNLNMAELNQYNIWLAHYTGSEQNKSDYTGHYEMWQYTSTGQILGIEGNVDMNLSYKNY